MKVKRCYGEQLRANYLLNAW